jgi:uncharacterized protein (TIGR00251 family)
MPLVIELSVMPGSGRQEAILDKKGQLKIFLKNRAEDGKANKELISYLSKALKIAQLYITLVKGATMRKKTVRIDQEWSLQQVLNALGIAQKQANLFE